MSDTDKLKLTKEEIEEKRNQIKSIIKELSLKRFTDEDIKSFLKDLKTIYTEPEGSERFHHYYSDFFKTIAIIKNEEQNSDSTEVCSFAYLQDNLNLISDYFYKNIDDYSCISDEFRKFYDHITLEIGRIDFSEKIERDISSIQNQSELRLEEIKKIKKKHKFLVKEQEKFVDELDKTKTNYISILGIFSSVVMAFTGGLAFSTSVLSNVKDTLLSKLLAVGSLVAFFFFNVIFILFDFIRYIRNGNDNEHGCKRDFKFFIPVNAVLLVILGFSSLFYYKNSKSEEINYNIKHEVIFGVSNESGTEKSEEITETEVAEENVETETDDNVVEVTPLPSAD